MEAHPQTNNVIWLSQVDNLLYCPSQHGFGGIWDWLRDNQIKENAGNIVKLIKRSIFLNENFCPSDNSDISWMQDDWAILQQVLTSQRRIIMCVSFPNWTRHQGYDDYMIKSPLRMLWFKQKIIVHFKWLYNLLNYRHIFWRK